MRRSEGLEGLFETGRFCLLDGQAGEAVEMFRAARPDNLGEFWGATHHLGRMSMEVAQGMCEGDGSCDLGKVLVGIPRGGYPMLAGAREFSHDGLVVTNDGGEKRSDLPLLPENFRDMTVSALILVDPVLDTGKTVRRTLTACEQNGVKAEKVILLTVIAHPPTVGTLLQEYPNLSIISADTESGIIPQPDGSRWLAGFGDAGGQVAASFAQDENLLAFKMPPGFYT